MNCIERSKIRLKNYQKKVIYFMSSRKNRSLLVVHPTGYGKTITAVTYSQCFPDTFPDKKVVVITPAPLESNFKKNLFSYGVDKDYEKKYEIYSFDKFQKIYKQIDCKNNLVIIDEVHILRNMSLGSSTTGLRAKAALTCVFRAKKILLMTATPFVNDLNDLISLVNLVHGTAIITKRSQIKSVDDFRPYLRGYVDYIKPIYDSNYPKSEDHEIKIKMEKDYEQDYCKLIKGQIVNQSVFSSPASFYNAHRRAVNRTGTGKEYFSVKMKKVLSLIGNNKTVIYSNWIAFGLDPICDALEEKGYTFEGFSGKIGKKEKETLIEEFNQDKYQVLIISPSGKQGIDLVGVRNVIIIDPVWHPADVKQIKGRAVRYGSHSHLPKNKRKVDVYYLILETSKESQKRGCLSGDSILYKIIEDKKELENYVYKMMEKVSI